MGSYKRFVDYLREEEGASAECGIGTSSADIATVDMPLGTVLRHTQKDYPDPEDLDDSLEFSLSESGEEIAVPKDLRKKIIDVYRERSGYRITEVSLTTDALEDIVSESLGEQFAFDTFKCYKSVIQFKSGSKVFKIYQSVPGIFGS